jgi:leucyl/phenylalanyl-tRNA--protein transferase
MRSPVWINHCDEQSGCLFPDAALALLEPNGLLAVGGNLEPASLINAYRNGIFPWYSADQPILWWSPEQRAVLYPEELRVSRSLRKTIRAEPYEIRLDTAFAEVMRACASPRKDGAGTWITDEMLDAYVRLHELGIAHSVEAWQDGRLVGGLYGVALGRVFFGESMFFRAADASKIAFITLVRQLSRWGYGLIDCQVPSSHLASLGAQQIPRELFLNHLRELCGSADAPGSWQLDSYGSLHGLAPD